MQQSFVSKPSFSSTETIELPKSATYQSENCKPLAGNDENLQIHAMAIGALLGTKIPLNRKQNSYHSSLRLRLLATMARKDDWRSHNQPAADGGFDDGMGKTAPKRRCIAPARNWPNRRLTFPKHFRMRKTTAYVCCQASGKVGMRTCLP